MKTGIMMRTLVVLFAPAVLAAQGTSSYTKPPAVPAPPALSVPAVKSSTLPNGIQMRVVEQRVERPHVVVV